MGKQQGFHHGTIGKNPMTPMSDKRSFSGAIAAGQAQSNGSKSDSVKGTDGSKLGMSQHGSKAMSLKARAANEHRGVK